jgi:hypothetical protein
MTYLQEHVPGWFKAGFYTLWMEAGRESLSDMEHSEDMLVYFLVKETSLACPILTDDKSCDTDAMQSWNDARACGAQWEQRHTEFYGQLREQHACKPLTSLGLLQFESVVLLPLVLVALSIAAGCLWAVLSLLGWLPKWETCVPKCWRDRKTKGAKEKEENEAKAKGVKEKDARESGEMMQTTSDKSDKSDKSDHSDKSERSDRSADDDWPEWTKRRCHRLLKELMYILAIGFVLLLFLPSVLWISRVGELCGDLENDHVAHYKLYAGFMSRLVGMRLSHGLLDAPSFDCPVTFGYGAARIFRGTTLRRAGPVVLTLTTFGLKYMHYLSVWWSRRQKGKQDQDKLNARNFAEVVQFSLCSLDPDRSGGSGTFRQYTLFELPLSALVKGSAPMVAAVLEAASYTVPEHPFLHQLDPKQWTEMRQYIISELSAKFYAGYVARDLGCPIVFDTYYFGLANEKSDNKSTSQKLRVILAKKELLEEYDDHNASGHVKLANPYFKNRWDNTLQNMADLHYDCTSKSLREIELCVAANRVALTQIDGKLDRLNVHLCEDSAWNDQTDWKPRGRCDFHCVLSMFHSDLTRWAIVCCLGRSLSWGVVYFM